MQMPKELLPQDEDQYFQALRRAAMGSLDESLEHSKNWCQVFSVILPVLSIILFPVLYVFGGADFSDILVATGGILGAVITAWLAYAVQKDYYGKRLEDIDMNCNKEPLYELSKKEIRGLEEVG